MNDTTPPPDAEDVDPRRLPEREDLWGAALEAMGADARTHAERELHRQVSTVIQSHRRAECPLCRRDGGCDAANNAHQLVLAWLVDRAEA